MGTDTCLGDTTFRPWDLPTELSLMSTCSRGVHAHSSLRRGSVFLEKSVCSVWWSGLEKACSRFMRNDLRGSKERAAAAPGSGCRAELGPRAWSKDGSPRFSLARVLVGFKHRDGQTASVSLRPRKPPAWSCRPRAGADYASGGVCLCVYERPCDAGTSPSDLRLWRKARCVTTSREPEPRSLQQR